MQRNQQFNFYQNGDNIKNYMVEYLSQVGSASKTLFGIELGYVCKTPNRGRTKLLLDTYPDLFLDTGDRIALRSSSDTSVIFSTPAHSPTPPVNRNSQAKNPELSQSYLNPQQFYSPPQPAVYQYSASNSSTEATWDPSMWYPQAPSRGTPYPATSYLPPAATYPLPAPQGGYPIYGPSQSYEGSMDLSQVQFQHPQFMYQYAEEKEQDVEAANTKAEKSVQDVQEVRCRELCRLEASQEDLIQNILKCNDGTMEVSSLLVAMGVVPEDQIGYSNMIDFLTCCSSITIQDGVAYLRKAASSSESGLSAVDAPDQDVCDDSNNESQHATVVESQNSYRSEVPNQSLDNTGDNDFTKQDDQEPKTDEDICEQGDLVQIGAKTIRVGSIHVASINIKQVNLHLHVEQVQGSQKASELLQLQQMMQEVFNQFNLVK